MSLKARTTLAEDYFFHVGASTKTGLAVIRRKSAYPKNVKFNWFVLCPALKLSMLKAKTVL